MVMEDPEWNGREMCLQGEEKGRSLLNLAPVGVTQAFAGTEII